MFRQPNNSIYKTVVVVWLTLSIASVVLSAVTWVDLSRKLSSARNAVAVRDELDEIFQALLNAETAQRGFTITGDARFLEPMVLGETNLVMHFDRLTARIRGDAAMLALAMDLRGKAEVAMAFHREVIAARSERGAAVASEMVATGGGRRVMDEIRQKVAHLRGLRPDLVSDEGLAGRTQLMRASLTSLVAGVLGVGAGFYAFWLARVMLGHQEREKRLVEARLEAERSSREKTVFLANMSHEIRTPMNAILGFSEILSGELQEPRHRQHLQAIRTSATSLLQLINDILDMSKIEAGVMELRLEPTDPREICDFLHTLFAEPASKKGVKLECVVAEDLPRALLMDRIRLRQILVNLVGNAVKFTDQGNIYVRVQWERQETTSHVTLLLEVQDTGVGIPQDKLEAVFKPFVQAGAHLEKEKSGTGLGLSIVRRLTEIMGGTVTAASVMGQGSAFSLRFPDVAVSARMAPRESSDPTDTAVDFDVLKPATVLVVDDNEANCELIAGVFASSAHRLVFGTNGLEAIEKARAFRPDIILLDIRMPGMDGRKALAEIRKIPGLELVPVVAVTASGLIGDTANLKAQFSGYVRKPFRKKDLFEEISQFLPRRDTQPADAVEADTSESGGAAASPELLGELRRLRETEWPALREVMGVNESRKFAAHLQSLALKWSCAPLEVYGRALTRHADTYAVVELEAELNRFPALVARLEDGKV